MKRRFKVQSKIMSLLLCLALAGGVLFGCSADNNDKSSAPPLSQPSAEESKAPTQRPTEQIDLSSSKYNDKSNWVYCGIGDDKQADLFLLCPTVYTGSEEAMNLPMDDKDGKMLFLGALNMERGIYEDSCRMYAPYYRQAGLYTYTLDYEGDDAKKCFDTAYSDVREAFLYYMENYNNGRPIVLAGFSQGADMSLRLMREFFTQEQYADLLVANYAIGWHISQQELDEYPGLKMAQGETDTGVIITFNTEEDYIETSILVPDTTLAINPLNWKTDSTPADKALNKGACFTDYFGEIKSEIPQFTGAYLDPVRGTLKVTDVSDEEYSDTDGIFEKGVYHVYDYQFFFRNLQENVSKRVNAYAKNKE